jgi:hypothetical protein
MSRPIIVIGILITFILGGSFCKQNDENISNISMISLIKFNKIPNQFSDKEDHYFLNIDDIVCDDEKNIFIADSGWNKIFKFDSQGRFLMSFGQAGQGPGDFLGQTRSKPLRMTFGNDKRLYILDPGNQRISIFSKEGRFLKQTRLQSKVNDSLQVNSKGDLFIISKSREHVVDCFEFGGRFKKEILDYDEFYQYLFFKEPEGFSREVNNVKLLKSLGLDDHLYIVSNLSLTVFHFDENCCFVNKFQILNDRILKDFRMRLQAAISKGMYTRAFLDIDVEKDVNLLWLIYFNGSTEKPEIYRYTREGLLMDILLFPDGGLKMFEQYGRESVCAVGENESGMDTIIIYTIPRN